MPEWVGKGEGIVVLGAFAILASLVLAYLGKIDGMALAGVAGAFFGGSAVAAFRK